VQYGVSCSGDGGTGSQSVSLTVRAAAVAVSAGSREYLQADSVALGTLDSTLASLANLSVTQDAATGGVPMRFKLGANNVLYVVGPAQQADASTSTLRIATADGTQDWSVSFDWTSRIGPALSRVLEADESGNPPVDDGVTLATGGLDLLGSISSQSTGVAFTLQGLPGPIDPTHTRIALHTYASGAVVSTDATSWFTADSTNTTYTLSSAGLTNLLSAISGTRGGTLALLVRDRALRRDLQFRPGADDRECHNESRRCEFGWVCSDRLRR